jgi:predicted nucleic acid-binding protein
MAGPLYLDTSVVLRSALERGATAVDEDRIRSATILVTSRLALVEAARAILRVRRLGEVAEERIADAEREIASLFARCEVFELSTAVCDLARQVAPAEPLRTLDALHLATYLIARRRIDGLELWSADLRLSRAAGDD